ncbi:MAG: choline dehydrogenase [Aquabacterium sp.]
MYDHVIVGAGSAGCVLAARLTEDPNTRVCLLEAGPADTHPLIHMPLGIAWMMRSKTLNWGFRTEGESELSGRRLFWPRGRVLGGSSSTNAMCYTRGHAHDYDAWAALGNAGWGYQDVLPYFRRAENHERGEDDFHGVGGPLNVAELRSPNPLTRAFVQAGVQAGLPFNDDFNGARQEGVGIYQVTQRNGRRWSVAAAYLGMAKGRENLTILTGAHARRVIFEGLRAVGVEYVRQGKIEQVRAAREVILSAGAIQSPQLLMLSGVGDQSELKAHGIVPVHDLPGVGKNLQDHLDVIQVHGCIQAVSMGITPRNLARGAWELGKYLHKGEGMFTSNAAEGGAFAKSSPHEPIPDLQFHFSPMRLSNHGLDLGYWFGDGYSLHVCALRPKSVGEIRLHSADPMAAPAIVANYLTHPDDMACMVKGVRLSQKILAAPAFEPYRGKSLIPLQTLASDEDIRQFIRDRAETIYHPVGTCKMGHDPMAVVDSGLRVHGLLGLRVVDASIMPLLVGGNTNAPTVMIAEKAADAIKAARHA